MMRGMSRGSGKRPPQKPVGTRVPSAPVRRIFSGRTLGIAAALAALTASLTNYGTHRGTPDKTTAGSGASSPTSPQRFIGGADDGYVDAAVCASCHREIAST